MTAFERALQYLLHDLGAPRALIVDSDLNILVMDGFHQDVRRADQLIDFSLTVLKDVLAKGIPRFDGDLQKAVELTFSAQTSQVRSLICIPFYDFDSKVQGLVYVDNRDQAFAFTAFHLRMTYECCRNLQIELYGVEAAECEVPVPDCRVPTPLEKLRESVRDEERRKRREKFQSRLEVSAAVASAPALRGQLLVFWRCLATLYNAGLDLSRSLHTLAQFSEFGGQAGWNDGRLVGKAPPASQRLGLAIYGVSRFVDEGESFSAALQRFPGCFPSSSGFLVKMGETSGTLHQVLLEIARDQETAMASLQRLRSALLYPVFSLVTALAMIILIPTLFAHNLLEFLQSSGQPLNWATRLLVLVARLWSGPGLLAIGLAFLGFAWLAWRRSDGWLERLHVRALNWPGIGRFLRLVAAARLARSMAMMLRSGLDIRPTLRLAVETTANPVLTRDLPRVMEEVEAGTELSAALRHFSILPQAFLDIARVSEESGTIPRLLQWLADLYEMEVELALAEYLAWIQPLVMLIVGVVVGACVLALMVPMVAVLGTL